MLEVYLLSSPASGALTFLYEDEGEKWGIHVIKEQCFSGAEGHKDVRCNVDGSVFLHKPTLLRLV
jgi:hypothetical protein